MRFLLALLYCSLVCASTSVLAGEEPEYFLDQFAPTKEERATWQDAQETYNTFLITPEFLGRDISKQDKKVRGELEDACIYNFKDCQTYIKANRLNILRALPDNPLYWDRFWQVLEVNVHTLLDHNRSLDYNRLVNTTYWWFYRDLALNGRIDTDHALALQTGLNSWLKSHTTLVGRMITVAMRDICKTQVAYAMAQASRDRDEDMLAKLIQASRPLPLQEISYGKTSWMEREFSTPYWRDLEATPEFQAADAVALAMDVPPEYQQEFLRFMQDPIGLYKTDQDFLAKHLVAESSKSWSRYWSEGIQEIDQAGFKMGDLWAIGIPAYDGYVAADRFSNFASYVFDALADIYTGRASPGLPGRPAPAYWRWDWQEGPYPKVCLVSDSVHPSTKQRTENSSEQMCIEYYDEQAVELLAK